MEGHSLTVEGCKRVTATEIISVDSFSDKQMVLTYSGGRIVISGSEMKIVAFSKTSGAFSAAGNILSVRYLLKGMGLKQRLFK